MSPDWRDAAHKAGVVVLAPFVSPALPGGTDWEAGVREDLRQAARGGDTRPLPVIAGARAIGAVRGMFDHADDVVEPDVEDPELGWVPMGNVG